MKDDIKSDFKYCIYTIATNMSIIRRCIALESSILKRNLYSKTFRKSFATVKDNTDSQKKLKEEDDKKVQAAKLAAESMKDLGSMFSAGPSSDEATQPIDSRPIYENPALFGSLSLLHQGQVLKELQEKYDKNWSKLTNQDKKLGYFIAYGNWGVRDDFTNWNTNEAPLDLPFHVPSKISTSQPKSSTIIKKIDPPVKLSETAVRLKQFDTNKMDGVTKFFIYLTIFISIVAISRDKNTGEEGKPVETIIEDPYETERKLRQEKLENEILQEKVRQAIELENQKKRKWYYLWLK